MDRDTQTEEIQGKTKDKKNSQETKAAAQRTQIRKRDQEIMFAILLKIL